MLSVYGNLETRNSDSPMRALSLSVSFHHPLQNLLVSLQVLHWHLGFQATSALLAFARCL